MSYFFLQRLKLAIFWHSATSDSVDHHCSSQQVWPQSQHVFKAENLSFILILHKLNRRQFIHTEAFHTMRRALHVLSAVMSLGQCECCKCIAFNSLLSQKLPQVAYQPLTVRQNVVIPKLHDESPCRINTDKSDKRNSHQQAHYCQVPTTVCTISTSKKQEVLLDVAQHHVYLV